jgi:prepilin-type processing-associated H-X9-DG protein
MSRPERRGFTRLELLAVLVAVFLLMGLLLPGYRGPQKMARRIQCMNNQKQIADAMTLFATTHGVMPAAMSSPIDPATGKQVVMPFGWVQGLFAELGRSDLLPVSYTMTAADAPNIALFICPDDGNKYGSTGGPLSYVVNGGGYKNWKPALGQLIDSSANGAWNVSASIQGHPSTKTTLNFIGVHKGLAQTISHSENIDARSYILSSPQADYEDEVLWDPSAPLGFNQDAGNGKLDNAHARPSSNHGGGAVVTFCDGHVAFISDSISYNVYATLMVSDPAAATAPPGFLVWPLNPSQIPVK